MGGKKVRGIGLVRARTDMLLMALAYNMRRYIHLTSRDLATAAA